MARVEPVLDAIVEHGEGPVWDAGSGVIYWVDITGCAVNALDTETGEHSTIPTGGMVGAIVPPLSGAVCA